MRSFRAAARLAGLIAAMAIIAPAIADVTNPIVTGPIAAKAPPGDPSHDYPQLATQVDIASQGYVEEEYFFEGTATRYSTPTLATGGVVSTGHPYRTRMIVRRPTSAERFNGIVVVEWVNVTSGYNLDAMWQASYDLLMREGYAYVGVSAQRVGVQQPPSGLTSWSPARYAGLDVTAGNTVPSDTLSYDIFSQAAQAIRHPMGVDLRETRSCAADNRRQVRPEAGCTRRFDAPASVCLCSNHVSGQVYQAWRGRSPVR
ncbi:MAG: hypothetical protein J2P28_09910 [Actinobacteria bacterium]|nr:hypothetical protein [Actinomycetota bacterium]